jgi:hypothetical protein
MAAAVAALVRRRRMWVGMVMVMVMGGGMARVVVRCRVPGFRDCSPLGLGQRRRVFEGSRHGWCFMELGLGLEVLVSTLVFLVSTLVLVESLGIGTGLHGILGQGIEN